MSTGPLPEAAWTTHPHGREARSDQRRPRTAVFSRKNRQTYDGISFAPVTHARGGGSLVQWAMRPKVSSCLPPFAVRVGFFTLAGSNDYVVRAVVLLFPATTSRNTQPGLQRDSAQTQEGHDVVAGDVRGARVLERWHGDLHNAISWRRAHSDGVLSWFTSENVGLATTKVKFVSRTSTRQVIFPKFGCRCPRCSGFRVKLWMFRDLFST